MVLTAFLQRFPGWVRDWAEGLDVGGLGNILKSVSK